MKFAELSKPLIPARVSRPLCARRWLGSELQIVDAKRGPPASPGTLERDLDG
jgi:hypothetical protein